MIETIVAGVVREGDHFRLQRTLKGDFFEHWPAPESTAPLVNVYAMVRYTDGRSQALTLGRTAVREHRYGVLGGSDDEIAIKAAVLGVLQREPCQ